MRQDEWWWMLLIKLSKKNNKCANLIYDESVFDLNRRRGGHAYMINICVSIFWSCKQFF